MFPYTRYVVLGLIGAFLPLAVLLASTDAQAQRVFASTGIDSVAVGERFTLTVVAEYNIAMDAHFPATGGLDADSINGGHMFGDLEVVRVKEESGGYFGSSRPGVRADTVVYEVTTFALNEAQVSPVPIEFSAANGTITYASSSFSIPVRSVVPDDAEGIMGLAPLADFPRSLWPLLLLVLLAASILSAAVYYWRQNRSGSPEDETDEMPPPQPDPADELALQRLNRLEQRTDFDRPGYAKPYFTTLVAILRLYVTRRLSLPAAERTSEELLHELYESDVPVSAVDSLKSVLQIADLAKFADITPAPEDGRRTLGQVRSFISSTEDALRPKEHAAMTTESTTELP